MSEVRLDLLASVVMRCCCLLDYLVQVANAILFDHNRRAMVHVAKLLCNLLCLFFIYSILVEHSLINAILLQDVRIESMVCFLSMM